MPSASRPPAPGICPVCGENVPPRALACPECGADHNSGWKEDATSADGLELPDNGFNYDEFVQKEFHARDTRTTIKPIWWIAALLALAALVIALGIAGW